jgi:hypothetical protein
VILFQQVRLPVLFTHQVSDAKKIAGRNEVDATHRDFVISVSEHLSFGGGLTNNVQMPYLHWETDEARAKMHRVIKDIEAGRKRTLSGAKYEDLPFSEKGKNWHEKAVAMMKQGALEKADADEMLLRTHLRSERPVHIRRTLDQSYYWTLEDTETRDRDQVVYRATKEENPRVVMVDQLWMWILDGSKSFIRFRQFPGHLTKYGTELVITSFPRRWGRKKSDPSGVYKSIRDKLVAQPELDNVYDMATMMIDQCSRVFFDRAIPKDNRPEVMDIFSNAIGKVVCWTPNKTA